MSRNILLALTAVVLLTLPLLSLAAAAQPDQEDRAWREEPRDLEVTTGDNGFLGTSSRDSALGSDEMTIRFYLDDGRFRIRYDSDEPGNRTVMTSDLTFVRLVEFRDDNGDGAYGFGDQVAQRIGVDEMAGSSVALEPFLTGGRVATVTYTFPDRSGNNSTVPPLDGQESRGLLPGHLALRFYMLPSPQAVEGDRITPMDVKFDIEIEAFPYAASGTRVALETRLSASEPVREIDWRDDALGIGTGYFQGYLGWTPTALVDGNERNVGTSTLSLSPGASEDATDVTMAFAYPRGEKVVHDPQMGIVRFQGIAADVVGVLIEGNWLLYSLGLLATVAVVGGPAVVRLRQDR